MRLSNIKKLLNCQVLSGENNLDHDVERICASELMSNVLTCTGANSILVTGLNNLQVVRTAEMSDISAVVFIQGKKPAKEVIELAGESKIVIMVTSHSLFKTCGLLFQAGLRCVIDECS